jgi:phosphatidylserine/phosphatidylglycerophosphate/cardiolipin synthase-like enzyme
MSVARQLVKAWRLTRGAGVALFQPGSSAAMARVAGWESCDLGADTTRPQVTVADAIRALEIVSGEEREGAHAVKLVATAPTGTPELATTRGTLLELVDSASHTLLVLGFGLTDERLRQALIQAAGRGVRITVVGERSRGDVLDFARSWPATVGAARFLQLVEPPAGVSAIMHAKVVVADRRRVLIGYANFTSGGLNSNLELGLRVEGPVAESICRLVETLESRRWLELLGH